MQYNLTINKETSTSIRQPENNLNEYSFQNNFLTSFQPKRTSVDIRSFMQLYRKKYRTHLIEKQFESNMGFRTKWSLGEQKGFRGKKLPTRDKRFSKDSREFDILNVTANSSPQHHKNSSYRQRRQTQGSCRPNFMYNLNLYRKKNRLKTIESCTENDPDILERKEATFYRVKTKAKKQNSNRR